MPGRGTPWRGVGKGVLDRIGTEDIKDLSITEADLDSALQAKVNTGGAVEKVGEKLLTGSSADITVSISPAVPIDDTVSEVIIVGTFSMDDSDAIEMTINGVTGTAYDTVGQRYSSLGVDTAVTRLGQSEWNFGANTGDDTILQPIYLEIKLGVGKDDFGGGLGGVIRISDPNSTIMRYAQCGLRFNQALTEINEFKMFVAGAFFRTDSRVTVYTRKTA